MNDSVRPQLSAASARL